MNCIISVILPNVNLEVPCQCLCTMNKYILPNRKKNSVTNSKQNRICQKYHIHLVCFLNNWHIDAFNNTTSLDGLEVDKAMDIHQASVRDHQGIELLIPQSYLDRTHFFWLEILLYSSILETHNCKSHVPRSFLKNCICSLNFNLNATNTVFKVGNTEIL